MSRRIQTSLSFSVSLRYLKSNGKTGTSTFGNVPLADGQQHNVLLHFSGLTHGTPRMALYVDCRLVEIVEELPAAFKTLPSGPNQVALKTMPTTSEVCVHSKPVFFPILLLLMTYFTWY